ncbi:uncharacterized protein LOC106642738 [Copidosoma floridanum]|uniref:uncharacterized protein LOC106642738 n=1 Tax=Copidosoma floridanum TaxID=29053 RepID=UPI000C6F9215|nr:uncharacterized protein LOC106642738 [Copidosoma floridanum]
MALILQVNLDRTVLAHDLLCQISRAWGADMLFINEPSRALPGRGWYCDKTKCAAILICSDKFSVSDIGGGDGFVWIRCGGAFYVSCYISPNISIGVFRDRIAELEDAIRVCRESGDVVLAGYFNSKAIAWGEPRTDPRGRAVLEMAARLDLIVMISGGSATFRRPGSRGTIIDLTLVSSEMKARVSDWQVLEDYTASYHQYVSFVISEDRGAGSRNVIPRRVAGWNVAKLNRDLLLKAMVSAPPPADLNKITNSAEAEALVSGTTRRVKEWCDACMPKRSARRGRCSCYWWIEDIANLRGEAQHLWRLAQRHRTREGAGAAVAAYKEAKKALVRATEVSKNRCWRELIDDIDKDTWSLGYRIALKRLRGTDPTPPMEPAFLERVVSCLFPEHLARRREEIRVERVPLFKLDELRLVASETPGRKAPDPDGVPSEVLKIIAAEKPHVLLDMFNACLRVGLFSGR